MTAKSNKILVTIPTDLHERVKAKADASRRSLSGYVGYVLDKEHPLPLTQEEVMRTRVTETMARLEAQSEKQDGETVVFFKDPDGVLMPYKLSRLDMSLRGLATALVMQEMGRAAARMLEEKNMPLGAVSLAKASAASEALTKYDKYLAEQSASQ